MQLATRQHRRSGLTFSTFGFGGTTLRALDQTPDGAQALAMIDAAFEGGVRYFDVAPFYGAGLAEHRMGAAMIGRARASYRLSTKVGRLLRPGRQEPGPSLPFTPVFDYSYDGVMRSFEDSLARLGVERIDILYIHDVSPRWAGNAIEERFETVMRGGYRALLALRESGTISAFGVGINDAGWCERFAEAGDFDLFMLAGRYTLLDYSAHDRLLPLCRERGIGVLLAAPFNSGILATGAQPGATFFYDEASPELMARTARIEAIAADHGVTLPAAALQFPLRSDVVLAVVAGSRTASEVRANLAHVTSAIPADFWAELAHQGLMPPG